MAKNPYEGKVGRDRRRNLYYYPSGEARKVTRAGQFSGISTRGQANLRPASAKSSAGNVNSYISNAGSGRDAVRNDLRSRLMGGR